MHNQRLLMLLLLIAYVFMPALLAWMTNPEGAWYRPYIIWIALIAAAYLYQLRNSRNDL